MPLYSFYFLNGEFYKEGEIMLFITGDIHGHFDISKLQDDRLKKAKEGDYLIICGDFGLIWNLCETKNEKYWLIWLSKKPWTTLFVDGNHENFDRLNSYPVIQKWNGKVHQITNNIYHLMRGEIYEIENKRIFSFGGAFSHDRIYRKENVSWWQDELPDKEECKHAIENLDKYNNQVDIIITHDAPKSLARRYGYGNGILSPTYSSNKVDILAFLEFLNSFVQYKVWFCDHYHMDLDDDDSFHFTYNKIHKNLES